MLTRRLSITVAALLLVIASWAVRPAKIPAQVGRALIFVDQSGLELGTILSRDGAHTAAVSLVGTSPTFLDAILAAEDDRFFSHGAVDAPAALRSLVAAVTQHRVPHGASTVSMQLARMIHPVSAGLLGRIEEVLLAARLENGNSKRRILEAYCNRVPMGGNVYGVEAAALTYFGVHASDLDLAQAALLAAIPNDPVGLNPYTRWRALLARQRLVLARMVAARRVTADDAGRSAAETLTLRSRGAGIVAAPHLLFWLARRSAPNATVVRTTIDRPLQQFVEEQLRVVVGTLAANGVRDAAALVVDNATGQVRAYAGSPDYFSDVGLGRNDGVQALRQPGSALKPFLYELALEDRVIRPNSVLLDAPVAYAIPGGRLYQPQDYDGRFLGPVRTRIALANSLNVPAVRVLERVGVAAFLDRLHALGFAHLRASADYYGLGLTLGGGEVSLYELTRAYARLARGGHPLELTALGGGTVRAAHSATSDPSWAVVTDMLSDKHARAAAFGVDSILALPFPAAVKTGTSSDFRDTWTVGFTRDYTVGVWVGNFDGTPMRDVSGVTGAGPLWNRIMLHLHEHREPTGFAPPGGYRRTAICATTGLRPTHACGAVVEEWLDPTDRVVYARTPARAARQPSVAVAFPHDGDRFAYFADGPPQRIDIALIGLHAGDAAVTVDAVPLERNVAGALTWNVRLGLHTIAARRGHDTSVVRIEVTPPLRRSRDGFSVARER